MRYIVLSVLIVSQWATSTAQTLPERPVQYSLKAGVNLSTLTGGICNDAMCVRDFTRKIGPLVGVSLTARASTVFSLSTELYFTEKGARGEELYHGNTWQWTVTERYLELQVLGVVSPRRRSGGAALRFVFGPAVGLKLLDRTAYEVAETGETGGWQSSPESFSWSVVLGGSVDFRFAGLPLSLDLRYLLGRTARDRAGEVKDRALSVIFGYRFR